ncbi:LPS export ABC transporter permease LptF [Duganella sp. BJB488]|nr:MULTISPECIES: LPS export ABC transporter permease LptF [unclassified Duganella]NVD74006.1 LPS export ABC transporter permease LptF [Duganella sp. BJB1802]RFP12324.1 LPS export ABC transporter permease LptF [Duganella sp. BJB489]RFP16581.1 LPS export ABC transporter permease LptF [Duganella sp. BJB488]RFP30688.1 LPS export ABC transporter permease LptF [Duganella sp. BJB480]
MIFQRALRREMASAAGATFTVLFSICVTWTLITVLGMAAGGKVASGDVLALIAFAALNYLPTLVILTSFISVLMVVTRTYRDSEMVVWFASGLSLTRWIAPVLVFGLPLVLATAALSFIATPWAKQKSSEYVERFEKREDLQKVSPGQFKESASANRIFFVEGVAGKSAVVQNVFVNTIDEHGTAVIVAREGVVNTGAKGERYLVLKNGRRYQGTPGQSDFQTMEFESYSMRVTNQTQDLESERNVAAVPIMELLYDVTPAGRAELLWRIASPVTCLVLILLAIPLGFVNPRAGSSANLIIAVLIFFSYSNLVKLVEANVKQGKSVFALSWWPLHLIVMLLVVALFAWRLNLNHRYHPLALLAALKRSRAADKKAVSP